MPDARITVNFHPDRLLTDGRSVAEHLVAGGVYRSQFETGISNGGLTAYPGGDRERWERRMFAGTPTAAHLAAVAPLRYHPGFVLEAAAFPAELRGPEAAALARTLDADLIDAAVIGRAARTAGSAETRQLLKYLWHILVLRGRPREHRG